MVIECFRGHRPPLKFSCWEVKNLIILSIEFKQSNCECKSLIIKDHHHFPRERIVLLVVGKKKV